jgi:hypothetical protein
MSSSPLLLLATLTCLALGCSGTAIGTDTGGAGETEPTGGTSADSPPTAPAPSPTDFEALFGAPPTTTITDGVVTGLWGGSAGPHDIRMKLGTSSVTIAAKCTSSSAVGAELAASVSISAIRILSSKEVRGNPYCYFDVRPRTIPRCESAALSDGECFSITGTTLRLHGVRLFYVSGYGHEEALTKLSD